MKMITAIIQPFMLTKLTRAFEEIDDFPGMTVADVRGFGREKAHPERGAQHSRLEDLVDFTEKVRVEVAAPDALVDLIVQTIAEVAHTGNRGDGKVFVWPIDSALRVRTGETAESAL
jgi:nitrogen regulatory protein PII